MEYPIFPTRNSPAVHALIADIPAGILSENIHPAILRGVSIPKPGTGIIAEGIGIAIAYQQRLRFHDYRLASKNKIIDRYRKAHYETEWQPYPG